MTIKLNTFFKKALSSYMPNRLMTWNVAIQQGNPMKSAEVNDLIKKIKKCEVHCVGAP
jgi:tRNA(Glu) U13 pseudouridine synthase TruD